MIDVLAASQTFWDDHARRDPLWAILSETAKRDGKWDVTRFFQTGASEIASLLYELDSHGISAGRAAALDFGCGVGRLTQALAPHFARVVGVDISPCMLELATKLNRFPRIVSYVCNQTSDLTIFNAGGFDFIVSSIALQHIEPDIARRYLSEFLRVLAPGGVLVFQLPSHQRLPAYRASVPIVKPMPDEAYQSSLVVTGVPERAVTPAAEITIAVEVTNISAIEWSQSEFGAIRVGDHWFDSTGGRMLTRDDGRTKLPGTLHPGHTCRLALTINAPGDPGEYVCEVDLAHEGVVWFRDKGAAVTRFAVRVRRQEDIDSGLMDDVGAARPVRATRPGAAPGEPFLNSPAVASAHGDVADPGAFPMYGVPLNNVVGMLASHGTTLIHIENDTSCGNEWVSYRYFVQKLKAAGRQAK